MTKWDVGDRGGGGPSFVGRIKNETLPREKLLKLSEIILYAVRRFAWRVVDILKYFAIINIKVSTKQLSTKISSKF